MTASVDHAVHCSLKLAPFPELDRKKTMPVHTPIEVGSPVDSLTETLIATGQMLKAFNVGKKGLHDTPIEGIVTVSSPSFDVSSARTDSSFQVNVGFPPLLVCACT